MRYDLICDFSIFKPRMIGTIWTIMELYLGCSSGVIRIFFLSSPFYGHIKSELGASAQCTMYARLALYYTTVTAS
jgi:hypothetical protein